MGRHMIGAALPFLKELLELLQGGTVALASLDPEGLNVPSVCKEVQSRLPSTLGHARGCLK